MMRTHLFDITKITDTLFVTTIRNCHLTQLPPTDGLAKEGEPTAGKSSKTVRVPFLLPTTDIGFKVFMESFMHFAYRIPLKYSRR